MSTLEFREQAGRDGILHLTVPVDRPDLTYRVVVQFEPIGDAAASADWPPDFFEATAGKWVGEFPEIPDLPFESRIQL